LAGKKSFFKKFSDGKKVDHKKVHLIVQRRNDAEQSGETNTTLVFKTVLLLD
jgi:hypothetical protein